MERVGFVDRDPAKQSNGEAGRTPTLLIFFSQPAALLSRRAFSDE
jgi:hypothetical protein